MSSAKNDDDEHDGDDQNQIGRHETPRSKPQITRSSHNEFARRTSTSTSYNGIHRRRRKRVTW